MGFIITKAVLGLYRLFSPILRPFFRRNRKMNTSRSDPFGHRFQIKYLHWDKCLQMEKLFCQIWSRTNLSFLGFVSSELDLADGRYLAKVARSMQVLGWKWKIWSNITPIHHWSKHICTLNSGLRQLERLEGRYFWSGTAQQFCRFRLPTLPFDLLPWECIYT